MTALYKKEVRAFLSSVIGAVVLAVFLLVSGLFHWVFPGQWNLLDAGVAELNSFFLFTPWVFLFLIPAITMRSIAEERKNGTLELLLTHPLDANRIVLAKFLAGTTLVAAALIPTIAGYIVLHQLGNPVGNIDGGSVLSGYLGLLLLGAAFVATGLATSARKTAKLWPFCPRHLFAWSCTMGHRHWAPMRSLAQETTLSNGSPWKPTSDRLDRVWW